VVIMSVAAGSSARRDEVLRDLRWMETGVSFRETSSERHHDAGLDIIRGERSPLQRGKTSALRGSESRPRCVRAHSVIHELAPRMGAGQGASAQGALIEEIPAAALFPAEALVNTAPMLGGIRATTARRCPIAEIRESFSICPELKPVQREVRRQELAN